MRFSTIFSTAILATSIFAAPYSGLRKRNEYTQNWAGAVITAPPADEGGFVTVIGTFVVPGKADENDVRPSGVSIWVGIDGFTNEVVVQAGVDSILDEDGEVTCKTWVQWSPNEAVYIDEGDFEVLPGDTVTVQVVTGAGHTSARAIFKNGNGQPYPKEFSTPDASFAALGQNMDWVVERIQEANEDSLMNFGTIQITDCSGSTTVRAGAQEPSQGTAVDMLNGQDGIAATTAIDGTTVTVTWQTG